MKHGHPIARWEGVLVLSVILAVIAGTAYRWSGPERPASSYLEPPETTSEAEDSKEAEEATALLPDAVRSGDTSAIAELMKKGADPHRPDESGTTALDYAQASGQEDIVSLLSYPSR